jgi:DNA polymerase-3 subunit epsilon
MDLEKLAVLFLDCQTTGANPRQGAVIEIGWVRSDTSEDRIEPDDVSAFVLKLPRGHEIPDRVQKITGITQDAVDAACEPRDVWSQLLSGADQIAQLNSMAKCPAVIHYAKFETPFLVDLHAAIEPVSQFPFSIICTHEIAKRLFPALPRRSLRAIAGYFGYSLGKIRRCREHILATAVIWREITRLLKKQRGIATLERLQNWLEQPVITVLSERIYPMSEKARRNLPDEPGIYRMLRSNGDVLYVGKAGSLKQRVNSYFRQSSQHPEHILEMLSQAQQIDVTVTESALEAAMLESDEIKQLSPPYNVALRGDGRDVWFCNPDLSEFSNTATQKFRTGPLVSQDAVIRFAAIQSVVKQRDVACSDEVRLMMALGMPEAYAPDMECILAGFEMFFKKYAEKLKSEFIECTLAEIGKKLWLQKLAEKEKAIDETEEFELESERVPMWTPELVCHVIESNVVRGTYELRRARWLVLLSESSLAWEETIAKSQQRFLIAFERGQVLFRRVIDIDDTPVPLGYSSSFAERQRSFDLLTADRMRVVTTEIRKALAAGRWVRLHLRPGVVLENERLAKMFKWI